ncbi:MAG: tripartite tricarboxylate transporter permease [Pseudomonadota bacterium]|nr:tripartite tricarboxylate transporter permease [Pseudomonadota bacterium]
MDLLHDIGIGFDVALGLRNLWCALFGAALGSLVGVLPGVGPVAAMALLLPVIARLDVTPALILLAAVYYGAQYGASTTTILLKAPAGSASNGIAIDGCQMARQGRAGTALSVAMLGSCFAGCLGTLVIAVLALPLAELAFRFGPAEYFSLMVLGLVGAAAFASGSFGKGLAMTLLGLLLAQVGAGATPGLPRFTFELPQLASGIGFVVVAIGLFGAAEVIAHLAAGSGRRERVTGEIANPRPTMHDLREAWPSVLRGTALGSVFGLLPGSGALLASFASYALEKKVVQQPRIPFGKGAIEGVAGPESANNAAAQTSFTSLLVFGIPANAVMALMVGVLTLRGIAPGPQVLTGQPQLFWGLIASMWVGNLMLVILNLPLAGFWSRLLSVPYALVFPAIVLLCCLGAYALGHRTFDIYLVAFIAFIGYCLFKLGCDAAPLLLGFIMEPMLEENLRHALLLSGGDWKMLVTRPLSSGLLIAATLLIVGVSLPAVRQKRELALHDE